MLVKIIEEPTTENIHDNRDSIAFEKNNISHITLPATYNENQRENYRYKEETYKIHKCIFKENIYHYIIKDKIIENLFISNNNELEKAKKIECDKIMLENKLNEINEMSIFKLILNKIKGKLKIDL